MYAVYTKKGGKMYLLNPSEKGRKYSAELKKNCKFTNNGKLKVNPKTNKPFILTKAEKAYRCGYVSARSDSAKAFKANMKKRY